MTGGSSFTGFHFAHALLRRGHRLTLTHRKPIDQYSPNYRRRMHWLAPHVKLANTCFGSPEFIELARQCEVIFHHGAQTKFETGSETEIMNAVEQNTLGLRDLLRATRGSDFLLSSSYYGGLYSGVNPKLFGPYGVSKFQTDLRWHTLCASHSSHLKVLTIPNPIGAHDNHKLLTQMARCWAKGQVFKLKTPDLIRDNIPVSLLAQHIDKVLKTDGTLSPSGWISRMDQFAAKAAQETASRTGWSCHIVHAPIDSSQPRCLHNKQSIIPTSFNPTQFWDDTVEWMVRVSRASPEETPNSAQAIPHSEG